MVDITTFLRYAKVAQVKDTVKIAQQLAFNGKTTVPDYVRLLYIVRKSVEFMFANNPSDPTLENVANYMYTLSGKRSLTPSATSSPFVIIVQPQSQTVTSGTTVSFSMAVAGGVSPITYQWYFNDNIIVGQTNSSITISPAISNNAGVYLCKATDSIGQVLTSNPANLVVNVAPLTASWYWNATIDPYPALVGGTDNLTYLGTVNFTPGSPIIIPWPLSSANNTYKVVRYPIGEGAKVHFYNNDLNQGSIPGVAYHEIVTIGSFLYVISKGDSIFAPFIVTYT